MANPSSQLSHDRFSDHFGAARLEPYILECQQDLDRVMALYRWNAALAGAFLVDLGHLEVPMRNALDARLSLRHDTKGRSDDWLDDPSGELGKDRYGLGKHMQPYKDVHTARQRVRENNKTPTHDQILSETPFGLWHQMVSKAQRFMWPDLAAAFPHAPDRVQETISQPVSKLRHFRNRVAHHHRIWALDCQRRHDDLLNLAGYLDPELRAWIEETTQVPKLLAERPR